MTKASGEHPSPLAFSLHQDAEQAHPYRGWKACRCATLVACGARLFAHCTTGTVTIPKAVHDVNRVPPIAYHHQADLSLHLPVQVINLVGQYPPLTTARLDEPVDFRLPLLVQGLAVGYRR